VCSSDLSELGIYWNDGIDAMTVTIPLAN